MGGPGVEPSDIGRETRHPYVTHTIRSGDTLSKIAKKYNVTTRQIRAVNKIGSPRRLKPGRALKIPVRETAASAGPTTSM